MALGQSILQHFIILLLFHIAVALTLEAIPKLLELLLLAWDYNDPDSPDCDQAKDALSAKLVI